MLPPQPLSPVVERFLRYVQIDTQSDPDSEAVPSTEKQKDLGRLLVAELWAMGVEEVMMDAWGYVFGTIPASHAANPDGPVLALLAHMDTAPDAPGANVKPHVHPNYDGGVIALPGNPAVTLDPARQPALLDHLGHDLITSDGTTLLGSDDKAGVAILMQLAHDLLADRSLPCPRLRLCFTIDEEIGRGVDHLSLETLAADVAYTLDGSGTRSFSCETFHAAEAVVTIEGIMAHPGYAKGVMINALRILVRLIDALPTAEAPENTDGRTGYLHPHTLTPGDSARVQLKIILRDFEEEGLKRRKDFLIALVQRLQQENPGALLRMELKDQYKNMRSYIEAQDRRVITFAVAAAQEMGFVLKEELVRGGTDGARLSERGLPTPNIFNGGHDYHSLFEWNTCQNMELSLAYTQNLVRYWALHG